MKDGKSSPHSDFQAPEYLISPIQFTKHFRRRYSDFFEFAPLGYFTFDRSGVILNVNPTGALLLGARSGQLVKSTLFYFYLPGFSRCFRGA